MRADLDAPEVAEAFERVPSETRSLWAKRGLSLGATLLFAAGLLMAHGLLLRDATPGVLLFSLGAILVAIRG